MRPEQGAFKPQPRARAAPQHERCGMRYARQRGVTVAVEQHRRKRRGRLDVSVTEPPCDLISRPVASRLRQRSSSGGEYDRARPEAVAFGGVDDKRITLS